MIANDKINLKHRLSVLWRALTALILLLVLNLPALACSTCGCSEICPIAVMETESGLNGDRHSGPTRTDSIVGNMLLKLAYARDPQLQVLTKKMKISSGATSAVIGLIASATLAQNVISMGTLNPPDGHQDSYVPGSIGIGLDGATTGAFDGRALLNYGLRKKYRARQAVICKEVDELLHHLEFSHMTCPEAQKQLVALIGDRASQDFADFWKASHAQPELATKTAEAKPATTLVSGENLTSVPPMR